MMEEVFLHLSGPNSALQSMVQILADFASAEGVESPLPPPPLSLFSLTEFIGWYLHTFS